MKKLSNLLSDVKIVEKRKWIFLAPVFVVAFALIMSLIFYFTSGSALNLGMDFVGGYTINVDVGAKLTSDNTDDYKIRVTNIVEDHDVKVSQILVTGTGDDTALQIRFKSIDGDKEMEEIVSSIIDEIKKDVTVIRPIITDNGNGTYTADYGLPVYQVSDEISAVFASTEGVSGLTFATDEFAKTVTFAYSGSLDSNALSSALGIDDTFAANVYSSGKVGAVVSQDLLYNALSAIIVALVIMLIYIAIRFEFKSGIAAIVALVHDLVIMFAFMAIFHIEFNSTFIAALITILGYSINNTIILFDRVRSNLKLLPRFDAESLANLSISQSFVRCLNTTVTTLLMIGSVAVVCAIASIFNPDLYQMVTFALPIIIGLISGLYSAMFVAPSVWVALSGNKAAKTKVAVSEANE
ncbi:MAG: protein translocase subunit SecF [Clostridia bacterium]|nr:protein translocase subunit SecF [Clostridia bacterium]